MFVYWSCMMSVIIIMCQDCSALGCGFPGIPKYGLVNGRSDWPDDTIFSPGTKIKYTCQGENRKLLGSEIRECTFAGNWTKSPPYCVTNIIHKRPILVEITRLNGNLIQKRMSFLTNGTVEPDRSSCLFCAGEMKYKFKFDDLETFIVDRVWINTAGTFPANNSWALQIPEHWICEIAPGTPRPIEIVNNTTETLKQLTVAITSKKSFDICEIEIFARSELLECGRPEIPINGIVSVTDDSISKVATYSCIAGYKISGSTRRICHGSRWNGTIPTCVATEPNNKFSVDSQSYLTFQVTDITAFKEAGTAGTTSLLETEALGREADSPHLQLIAASIIALIITLLVAIAFGLFYYITSRWRSSSICTKDAEHYYEKIPYS